MKSIFTIALLSLALVGCASGDGFIDESSSDCASGSGLEINGGWDPDHAPYAGRIEPSVVFLVEVTNLTDDEITVESIRVDPSPSGSDRTFQLHGGGRRFDKAVAEGASSVFDIPMSASNNSDFRRGAADTRGRVRAADLSVVVALANGETHRCRFRVPVPD